MGFDDLIGAIGEEAARQRGAIRERAEAEAREILRAAEFEGVRLLEEARVCSDAGARCEAARVLSRARLAARREILAARQRLVEEAFLALDGLLQAVVSSPAYDGVLLLLLRECVEGQAGAITVRCRAADRAALEQHARSLALTALFEETPLPLGGVETAAGPDGRVVSRNGLADRLEAARPALLQEAGRTLFGGDERDGGGVLRDTTTAAGEAGAQP